MYNLIDCLAGKGTKWNLRGEMGLEVLLELRIWLLVEHLCADINVVLDGRDQTILQKEKTESIKEQGLANEHDGKEPTQNAEPSFESGKNSRR